MKKKVDDYNIPQSRKEKIQLLKDLQTGVKTISDIVDTGYKITLHLDPTDEEREAAKNKPRKKGDFYITLNLD